MLNLKNEKRWIKTTVICTSIFVFFLCALSAFIYGDNFLLGSPDKMDNDDVRYIRSALIFGETGQITYHRPDTPSVYIMPGIVILLSPFVKLLGAATGVTAFRVFQGLLQALCIYLIFLIGRESFNSTTGAIAAVLDAMYLPEIFASGLILTEVPFRVCLLLLIYLTIKAFKLKKARYYGLGGAAWAAACLFRPTIALYPSVILIMWLIKRYSLKEMLQYAAVAAAVFSVIMAPWWIRNYIIFEKPIPLTVSSGNPFLQGTYIDYDQSKDYTPYLKPLDDDIMNTNQTEMDTGKARLARYASEKPLQYLYWYTVGKTLYFWKLPFYWRQVFGMHLVSVGMYHYMILGAGLLSAIFSLREKGGYGFFLLLIILYFNLVHLPFFTSERYAYPVMSLVIILAAYAADSLIRSFVFAGRKQSD